MAQAEHNGSHTADSGGAAPRAAQTRVDSAVAELKEALAILEEKGAHVHVHLADGNPSLPKLPD